MTRRRRDPNTLDLFRDYDPGPVVERFDEARIRSGSLQGRVARAVAAALRDCPLGRDKVALAMGEWLGERVPASMLDAYASQAKDSHKITAARLVALAVVTEDPRLINALLADAGLIAVPADYEALIRREMVREARDRLEREYAAADAQWRARR